MLLLHTTFDPWFIEVLLFLDWQPHLAWRRDTSITGLATSSRVRISAHNGARTETQTVQLCTKNDCDSVYFYHLVG